MAITKEEWRAYAEKQWPKGKIADRRKIIRCSTPGAWYENMVGQTIAVHYFVTFGCYDLNGRWMCYYDMSAPV